MKQFTKTVVALSIVFLLLSAKAESQEFQPSNVTGKTYMCFFVTPLPELGFINSNLFFDKTGVLFMSGFTGAGVYLGVDDFFAGAFYAIKARVGAREYDIIFALTGLAFDPILIGTGVALVDYSIPVVVGFAGLGM